MFLCIFLLPEKNIREFFNCMNKIVSSFKLFCPSAIASFNHVNRH